MAIALGALACAASAGAATTIGSDLADIDGTPEPANGIGCSPTDQSCTYANLVLESNAHPVSASEHGVITLWRVRAENTGGDVTLSLRVLRPAAGGAFTGAGTSPSGVFPFSSLTTLTFPAGLPNGLPIRAGDLIGLDVGPDAGNLTAATDNQATSHSVRWQPPLSDGATLVPDFVWGPPDPESTFNADVEPDLDCDGLGDETQDDSVPGDCTVALTGKPKSKLRSRKKRATVSFAFAGPSLATGLQCSLDGAAFSACASPFQTTVKRGAHVFAVRALDPDGTPGSGTSHSFKLLKKKKKKRKK